MNWYKLSQKNDIPEWDFPEADHDYDPNWDYDVDVMPDAELVRIAEGTMSEINDKISPSIGIGKSKAAYINESNQNTVARYIYGTAPNPVFVIDLNNIKRTAEELVKEFGGFVEREIAIGIRSTLIHELGHAIQDWMGMDMDEDEAEEFARTYCDWGEIWNFWE